MAYRALPILLFYVSMSFSMITLGHCDAKENPDANNYCRPSKGHYLTWLLLSAVHPGWAWLLLPTWGGWPEKRCTELFHIVLKEEYLTSVRSCLLYFILSPYLWELIFSLWMLMSQRQTVLSLVKPTESSGPAWDYIEDLFIHNIPHWVWTNRNSGRKPKQAYSKISPMLSSVLWDAATVTFSELNCCCGIEQATDDPFKEIQFFLRTMTSSPNSCPACWKYATLKFKPQLPSF